MFEICHYGPHLYCLYCMANIRAAKMQINHQNGLYNIARLKSVFKNYFFVNFSKIFDNLYLSARGEHICMYPRCLNTFRDSKKNLIFNSLIFWLIDEFLDNKLIIFSHKWIWNIFFRFKRYLFLQCTIYQKLISD